MTGNWRKVPLGALYLSPSRNGLTKPKRVRGEGFKFINMGEIFAHERMLKIPCDRAPATAKELASSALEPGDLLFARQSLVLSGAGKCAIFLGDDEPVIFESHLIRVRVDKGRVNPEYLFYYFKSSIGRAEIWSITEQGAGQSGIRGSDLEGVDVYLPPLHEQKQIVKTLSTLDNKIELNRQMNATLESMAQALFKSWFVDFDPVIDNALAAGNPIPDPLQARAEIRAALGDKRKPLPEAIQQQFPDRFVFTEEMGWVPAGWRVGILQDLLVLQRGFDLPKTNRTDGLYPLMVASGQDGTHNQFKVRGPGITTGRSGKLGDVCLVLDDFWPLNTTLWVKEYRNSSPFHAYYLLKGLELGRYNSGSAVPTLNRNHVHNIPVVVPPVELINQYDDRVSPFYRRRAMSDQQGSQLGKLRDTLLPKLLSGELRISAVESLIEEVG